MSAREAGGRLWLQLYVMKDRDSRPRPGAPCRGSGYEALVFTTDANVFGSREWDQPQLSRRPVGRRCARHWDVLRHPRWLAGVAQRAGCRTFATSGPYLPAGATSALGGSTVIPQLLDATICWDDLAWMREVVARQAARLKGCWTCATSTRGGARAAMASCSATTAAGSWTPVCGAPIEVLPAIARASAARASRSSSTAASRRGTEVVKALALGAMPSCSAAPRCTAWPLAGERRGRAGPHHPAHRDRSSVLGELGCTSVADLTRSTCATGAPEHGERSSVPAP